jgi:hypothetical protein
LLEALRFTSGVSNCSNDRVTFRKIHNTRFTIRSRHAFAPQRGKSIFAADCERLRGYRFMDAPECQNSLMIMRQSGRNLRGKQCMTGVDPIAIMRQHAREARQTGPFRREIQQ